MNTDKDAIKFFSQQIHFIYKDKNIKRKWSNVKLFKKSNKLESTLIFNLADFTGRDITDKNINSYVLMP